MDENLFAMIKGLRIARICLLVWPDSEGLEETDVSLHLHLDNGNGDQLQILISTAGDGQTPKIEHLKWPECKPYSLFDERVVAWSDDDYFKEEDNCKSECFDISNEANYKALCGSVIERIAVIKISEDGLPTGICIETDNGMKLWSVPSVTGNAVMTDLPKNYFPFAVEYRDI